MKREFFTSVRNGEADLSEVAAFTASLQNAFIIVTVDSDDKRSQLQNRLFHGAILPAIQQTLLYIGMPGAEDRGFIREVILKKPFLTVNHGTEQEYIKSTAELTTLEFWRFCNNCLALLAYYGGDLDAEGQRLYKEIVYRYGLSKSIDEAVK